jgi:type II secretory pathway component PulC
MGGMNRLVLALALVASAAGIAAADSDTEPLYACKPLPPTTKISVQFAPETNLKDLTAWMLGFTCKNVVFASDVPKYATKITVIAPQKLTPKQAMQLYVDAVQSTGLVVEIKPDTIVIKLGPGMPKGCPDASPTASSGDPLSRPDPVAEKDEMQEALDSGIKEIDATHHTIRRDVIDKILANPMAVAKGARVVPSVKDGKPEGFKLYAIRPLSVYAKLGLANGDTLVNINGFELTSADKALEVYTKLRDAQRIDLAIIRRGKPMTLTITIVK